MLERFYNAVDFFWSTDWNGHFVQEHQCAVMLSVSASLFPHEL